jgi:hypothetical protein
MAKNGILLIFIHSLFAILQQHKFFVQIIIKTTTTTTLSVLYFIFVSFKNIKKRLKLLYRLGLQTKKRVGLGEIINAREETKINAKELKISL